MANTGATVGRADGGGVGATVAAAVGAGVVAGVAGACVGGAVRGDVGSSASDGSAEAAAIGGCEAATGISRPPRALTNAIAKTAQAATNTVEIAIAGVTVRRSRIPLGSSTPLLPCSAGRGL
jgi:hypothetical protein